MLFDTIYVQDKYLKEGRWDIVLHALNQILAEEGFKLTSSQLEGDDKVFFQTQ